MRVSQAREALRAFLDDAKNAGVFIPLDGVAFEPVTGEGGLRSADPYRLALLLCVVVAQQQRDLAALAARVAALEARVA